MQELQHSFRELDEDLEDPKKTYGKILANKYGKPGWEDIVKVTITVSEGLVEEYQKQFTIIIEQTS